MPRALSTSLFAPSFTAWLMALVVLLATTPASAAIDEDDLLPVDEAFVLSARAVGPDSVRVQWQVADGYYLYRHRMSAEPAGAGERADALALPRGKAHVDEFFGRVETFRGRVAGEVGGIHAPGGRITLKVKYQGCADLGICYPPQQRVLSVALPGPVGAASAAIDGAPDESIAAKAAPTRQDPGFAALSRSLAGGAPAASPLAPATSGSDLLPLPPEQAFGFEAIAGDGNTLLLRFTPANGYYLYRDRSSFRLEGTEGIASAGARWPKGVPHHDEHFGDVIVYFEQVEVPLSLRRARPDAAKATLVATFQGCQTDGICYPPMTRRVALEIPEGTVSTAAAASGRAAGGAPPASGEGGTAVAVLDTQGLEPVAGVIDPPNATDDASATGKAQPAAAAPGAGEAAAAAAPEQAEDTRLAAALSSPGRWLALLGFFAAGLGLAFTPCVLPMVPILSGLIAGRGERIGAARAFGLSLVYVLATAVVFTAAGIVAGLLGANLQVAFQTPWIIVLFAALFVLLSLSMFGLYELQLPAGWRAKLGAASDRQHGGSMAGVAAMGALSALIVGPCVAPPLAAAVLYIGQQQDPVFGGLALFVLAMGMGAPLLAFGVAAGKGLPTSGPWMVAVQRVFGFVFLGLAVWMLSRILPGPATLAAYGVLALALAAWLFAQAKPDLGDGRRWALRGAGMVLAVIGTAQLLGALAGAHDPLRPLAGVAGTRQAEVELPFRTIKSVADLQREVAAAQAAGKPLLFDFYADWCVACKEMEKYTFTEPAVQAALGGFVLLKADVTANDDTDQALMRELGVIGPPATLFYVDGAERRELRLFGFEAADDFVQRVARAR